PQLERALGLLIDRLLARRERRGRTLRAVVLSALLVGGGTWRARLTFREPLADRRRMRLVLVPRLADLPAPAEALRLRAEGFGPPTGEQRSLLAEPAALRAARLREAVRQARSVAGPEAALRILPVDPDSRVPERRLALTPWDPCAPRAAPAASPSRAAPGSGPPPATATRSPSAAAPSSPSGSPGWSRTAGGRTRRCAAATGR